MDLGRGYVKSVHVSNSETDIVGNQTSMDYQRDKPLLTASHDKFKHTHYVKVIKDILVKSETPINIGLYGRWGVGKSSILNMLREELEKKPLTDQFRYLFVDAWGLSHISLKQEVLVAINSQLKTYSQSEIEDILYNIREETTTNIKNVFKRGWPFFTMFGVGLAVAYVLNNYYQLGLGLLTLMTSSTGLTILAAIIKFSIGQPKRIIPKAVSSHQFDQIYKKMVKKETKKLVVVIDNLDRCEDRVAVELLGLIQTFMTKPSCINILACDDEAILKHLQKVKGSYFKEREGNEFLSKFFQVTIKIPPFIGENLDTYAQELILQRSIPLDLFVKQILISGAIRNPRKINQFLNNVVALYRLAEFKENDKRLPSGSITVHTAFLTKMVVLRHEWPLFYTALERDPRLLDKVNEFLNPLLSSGSSNSKEVESILNEKENEGLKDFLSATQYCTVQDIRPFLRLNQETYEGEIPEIEKFELDVNNNRLGVILETLTRSDEKGKEMYIKKMMAINNKHAEGGVVPALLISTSVLIGVLDIIAKTSFRAVALENLGRHMSSTLLRGHLEKFDLTKLFNLINEMPSSYRDILYNTLRGLIKTEEKPLNTNIIRLFLSNNGTVPIDRLNEFAQQMANLLPEHEDALLDIIQETCTKSDWISNRCPKPVPFITGLINRVMFDNSVPDNKRLDSYLGIRNNLDTSEKEAFVIRLRAIVDNKTYPLLPKVREVIQNLVESDIKGLESAINELFISLVRMAENAPDVIQKQNIFEVLFSLYIKVQGVEGIDQT